MVIEGELESESVVQWQRDCISIMMHMVSVVRDYIYIYIHAPMCSHMSTCEFDCFVV